MNSDKTTTAEALLGVLSLQPMSGYEMRQFMEQSTANFWRESFGQIYPALRTMLAEGLVEVKGAAASGGQAKKVYRITADGEAHLRQWLGLPARPQVWRNELLLKVFFGERAGPGVVRWQVQEWKQRYEAELRRYEEISARVQAEHAGHPGLPYWLMTVRYGVAENRAVIGWCEETLQELEKLGTREQGVGSRE